MSSGRLFQSLRPAEANDRSPAVTRRDGRTSSWQIVPDMTYNVFGGTLNPTQSINIFCLLMLSRAGKTFPFQRFRFSLTADFLCALQITILLLSSALCGADTVPPQCVPVYFHSIPVFSQT